MSEPAATASPTTGATATSTPGVATATSTPGVATATSTPGVSATSTAATRVAPLERADAEFFAAARLRAARLQPYLATAVFALVPVASSGLGTFAVDRYWRVYVDVAVAREWGVEQSAAVLVHEAHHVLRQHHSRALACGVTVDTHDLWNLAADAAINDDLLDDRLPLPDGVLPRHLGLAPRGLEEEYYAELLDEASEHPHDTCGSGSGGAPADCEIVEEPEESGRDGLDDVDAEAVRRATAHDVTAAASRGECASPGLVLWARDLLHPQVPWRHLLRTALGRPVREVTGEAHADWTRPDRRADAREDFPRPGNRYHAPDIAVVVDTSASMDRPLLDAAVTEINGLLRRNGVRSLVVLTCDVESARPQRVRRLGDLVLRGGGGTDMRVGIAAAAACRPQPSVVVVLTDGETPWPSAAPARTSIVAVVIGPHAPLPEGPGFTSVRITGPT